MAVRGLGPIRNHRDLARHGSGRIVWHGGETTWGDGRRTPLPQATIGRAVGPSAGGSAADSETSPTKRGINLIPAVSIYTDTRKRKIHLNFHTADRIVPHNADDRAFTADALRVMVFPACEGTHGRRREFAGIRR